MRRIQCHSSYGLSNVYLCLRKRPQPAAGWGSGALVSIGAGESYEITFVQKLENPGIYLIHFLALNGIDPSAEEYSVTGGLPYKYSVGVDQYVVVE